MAISRTLTPINPATPENVAGLDARRELLAPLLHGQQPTSRELLHAFAAFMETDIAFGDATEDTVRAYYREVKAWMEWCFARGVDPAQAERRHVEDYRAEMKFAGWAVSTRVHKLSIVRRFYDAAIRHDLITRNPAAGVHGGKDLTPSEEKVKALTENSLERLLASLPGGSLKAVRDRAIICLMAIHGLRRVEIHRLDHENVTWPDGEGENASPAVLLVVGKGKKQRKIYLRRDTWRALCVYITAKRDAGWPTSGALFIALDNCCRGGRISRRSLNTCVVDTSLEALGLKREGVSCHALRHTHATIAVKNGVPIEHLRDEMGHGDIQTTSRYVRAVGRLQNNPANFIGPGPNFGGDED